MATMPSLIFIFIFFSVVHNKTSAEYACATSSCEKGGVSIRFPFSLRQRNESQDCGYPGFEVSCTESKTSQPLLTLPVAGDFVVKLINLREQIVWINDPEECLPKRFMSHQGLNLKDSPFRLSDYYTFVNFSFFNCPSNLTSSLVQPISCLNHNNKSDGNLNYSVVAMMSNPPFPTPWTSSCHLISSASIPVGNMPWLFWNDYKSDIPLQWDYPDCKDCEVSGGRCGFLGDPTFPLLCHDLPNQDQGLSRKVKYGITMGLGIPGLVSIIGLVCFFFSKKNMGDQRRQPSTEFSTLIIPHPPAVVTGLDGATIEKFPKTQLGESGRLPKPNDNTCSICLCEYQPKEELRTIPECNHYFHANCIDGWLKMNATCPLCRNLPQRSTSLPSSLPLSPTFH